ncbi:serine carboxypeptidase-like 26 [Aristolochia californica]|uniref:serine carboxypeptidase-like 26 n=1 Tax=Aristolochia californica TaxID=171875 RepID=UPI0035DA32FA
MDELSAFLTKCLLFLSLVLAIVPSSRSWRADQAQGLQALLRTGRVKSENADCFTEKWRTDLPFQITSGRPIEGDMSLDLIPDGLPGQPSGIKFKQYAGCVTVDESTGRHLFYYFAEAAMKPSEKPLLLWLNGGPGCSSLGFGAMTEIGPFGVNSDGKSLYWRRHSWNREANVLFLESPAGVGFSYSNRSEDYYLSGDNRTAHDSYTFLVNWFNRFPHYKRRPFFIAGESYAGFYIPEVVDIIVQANKKQKSVPIINLKALMIGNGIMNLETDRIGIYDYLWSHALISDQTHQGLIEHCALKGSDERESIKRCLSFSEQLQREVGQIDYYNIYAPICSTSSSSRSKNRKPTWKDPCVTEYVHEYLNLPQVQHALHANQTGLPYPWAFCSHIIRSWADRPSTMFPIYRRLISAGVRILLYSGDVDAVVPVTATRYSVRAMNLSVLNPWKPWSDATGEVGGYRVVYEGLTLATIRGAGHEVPFYQPRRARVLLKYFLAMRDPV